ncbi:hypothetical protein BDV97DRAFT_365285 [Delphinella strobiligena]|nr:hypothetical protein BDV97DRAFT_365285 [Delphinella strobiligena]
MKIPEWKLDIFTIEEELPFAGHPVSGSACLTVSEPVSSSSSPSEDQSGVVRGKYSTKAGVIEPRYNRLSGEARARIPHNVHIHDMIIETVLAQQPALSSYLRERHQEALRVDVVSPVAGLNFGIVELPDLEASGTVTPPGARVTASLDREWDGPLMLMFLVRLPGVGEGDTLRLRTRMVEGGLRIRGRGARVVGSRL